MQAAEQDYEKEKLSERIAKLSGGVAVIQVKIYSLKYDIIYGVILPNIIWCNFVFHMYVGWSTN